MIIPKKIKLVFFSLSNGKIIHISISIENEWKLKEY